MQLLLASYICGTFEEHAGMGSFSIGLFQKLEASHPQEVQAYFKLKIWKFPGLNFDLKKKKKKEWEFWNLQTKLGIPNF